MLLCCGNIRGVSTKEYASTLTTVSQSVGLIFWSTDHRGCADQIEWTNSPSYPQLLIDANRIKWLKIHILFLDFDWCPIEVTITLHFNWTSIGSLGWIVLWSHSSLMKRKAFHLRRGRKKLIPLRTRTQNRSYGPQSYTFSFIYGAMNILALLGVPLWIWGKTFWK
jgi:hypothetical protein